MSSGRINIIDVNKQARAYSDHLLGLVFKYLAETEEKHGSDVARLTMKTLLTDYIATMVYNTVNSKLQAENSTKEEKYKFAEKNFLGIKVDIEAAVANGVGGGLQVWAGGGRRVDYYCLVKPVGDPVNVLPC